MKPFDLYFHLIDPSVRNYSDSHVGMLRLLLWIYTRHVENANHGAVVDDLIAADRFQLLEMKRREIMKLYRSRELDILH